MKKSLTSLIVFVVIGLIVVIILSSQIFFTLQPGERGVVFKKFSGGLDKENVLSPGFHVIAPWNKMNIYDVKEQIQDEGMDVLDKNGLSIHVDVTVRYYPSYDKIGTLHEKFGKDYRNKLVIPEVRSEVRKVMGRFTAEEIYSTKRKQVEQDIVLETANVLNANNVEMKALLIRSISLPEQISKAIETKLEKEQQFIAMQYELKKAAQQARKDSIEAAGKAQANYILNSSLTPNLMRMRGIEATLKLANSSNSKVVVVGGSDGLPLILNSDK